MAGLPLPWGDTLGSLRSWQVSYGRTGNAMLNFRLHQAASWPHSRKCWCPDTGTGVRGDRNRSTPDIREPGQHEAATWKCLRQEHNTKEQVFKPLLSLSVQRATLQRCRQLPELNFQAESQSMTKQVSDGFFTDRTAWSIHQRHAQRIRGVGRLWLPSNEDRDVWGTVPSVGNVAQPPQWGARLAGRTHVHG